MERRVGDDSMDEDYEDRRRTMEGGRWMRGWMRMSSRGPQKQREEEYN